MPMLRSGLKADLAANLPLLAALHDVGKFSRAFQAQVPEHWPADILGPIDPRYSHRHDELGLIMLMQDCAETLRPLTSQLKPTPRRMLLTAIAGHHGRPVPYCAEDAPPPAAIGAPAIEAARAFIGMLLDLFTPSPLAARTQREAAEESWLLAGLIAIADWIGSSQQHFPYVAANSVSGLADYWHDCALPRAAAAVAATGIAPASPSAWRGVRHLFRGITVPTPVQTWAETVALPSGPVLAVIEDATGSGKTEAALALAHRLLAEGRAHGLFIGLPTMATAGAMYRRLAEPYQALFEADPKPSLALSHGQARLDDAFAASIMPDAPPRDEAGDEAEPAGAQCAAWLAEESRRALFAQVVVGTIDQALLSVLPVRHAPLRQIALAGKVLILDEVHAYDAYMTEEIKALLARCAAAGGSAILLSATLPRDMRASLLQAFAGSGIKASSTCYPLATLCGDGELRETPRDLRDGLARQVRLHRLDTAEAAIMAIAEAAAKGAAVAWIRNTVDDAIEAHAALRAAGIEATLFHARFAMCDRLRIEQAVLARFGPAGTGRAHVLVATQVIEQSLDLDVDVMVTDLAPADLVIQRAGRLRRHSRPERPVTDAPLYVLSPEPVDEPPKDWLKDYRGTAAIYSPWVLWQSARALFGAGVIDTPGNVRALVEAAYSEGLDPPKGMEQHFNRYDGGEKAAASIAQLQVLAFGEGYSPAAARAGANWDPDVRIRTRLERQQQVTLRLAKVRDGRVVPYADDPDPARAWALSEVQVPAHRVAEAPVPPGVEAAAEAARAGWGRWEREAVDRLKLVMLTDDRGQFRASIRQQNGGAAQLTYSAASGVVFAAGDPVA